MTTRRQVLVAVGAGALAVPLSSLAQQRKVWRIGIIDDAAVWDPFRQQLRDLGYVEGKNLAIEYRSAEGRPERLAAVATELARLPVDVIAVFGTPAARAAKQATGAIPIVMISIGDPVKTGLVESLARPGGNLTGNTILGPDIAAKRLQLLKVGIPAISRVAFLWNPENASNVLYFDEMKTATVALGLKLISVAARSSPELDARLPTMMKERPDALVMTNDPLHQIHIRRIIDFLAANRVPGMHQQAENVRAGGIMSYGANLSDLFKRGAVYVHKILQGTKPANLPIEQPTRFELVINHRAAKAMRITLSKELLLRADEVIE